MTALKDIFDTRPCSRCGGSGRYSWNQMHGDVCYGCSGVGAIYTRKAAPFVEEYRAIVKARKETTTRGLEVGDRVAWYTERKWHTIAQIIWDEPTTSTYLDSKGERRTLTRNPCVIVFDDESIRETNDNELFTRAMNEATRETLRDVIRRAAEAGVATLPDHMR